MTALLAESLLSLGQFALCSGQYNLLNHHSPAVYDTMCRKYNGSYPFYVGQLMAIQSHTGQCYITNRFQVHSVVVYFTELLCLKQLKGRMLTNLIMATLSQFVLNLFYYYDISNNCNKTPIPFDFVPISRFRISL